MAEGEETWTEYRRLILRTLEELVGEVKALDIRTRGLERQMWMAVGALLALQIALGIYSVLK